MLHQPSIWLVFTASGDQVNDKITENDVQTNSPWNLKQNRIDNIFSSKTVHSGWSPFVLILFLSFRFLEVRRAVFPVSRGRTCNDDSFRYGPCFWNKFERENQPTHITPEIPVLYDFFFLLMIFMMRKFSLEFLVSEVHSKKLDWDYKENVYSFSLACWFWFSFLFSCVFDSSCPSLGTFRQQRLFFSSEEGFQSARARIISAGSPPFLFRHDAAV